MAAGRAPAALTLGESLRWQWARLDVVSCLAAVSLQLVVFSRVSTFKDCAAEAVNFAQVVALLALHCGGAAARLRRRCPVLRELLVLSIRGVGLVLVPNTMDLLGAMQPDPHPPAAAAQWFDSAAGVSSIAAGHGPLSQLSSLGPHLRSTLLLALGVCWVHACIGATIGWQLRPVPHAAVHTACVAALCWRAPRVCKQFVGSDPHNARVAAAAYWVLQQVTSLLCLGSRCSLEVAARASSDCQKCVAVAWAVQLSLGLVLPTLLVWTAQLNAAKEWAMQQQGGGGARTFEAAHPADQVTVQRSQWGRVCEPVLQAASACPGGWLVALPLTALVAFVAAVVAHFRLPHMADRCL